MKVIWAIAAGLALGVGAAWWLARDTPQQVEARQRRADQAAADARPALYRWHDANGVLQVTEQPPEHRKYERIDKHPRKGIEIHGDRD